MEHGCKVLVTGGAGFVGRHIVRALLEAGSEVTCVDSLSVGGGGLNPLTGWPDFDPLDFKTFAWIQADCRDYFKSFPREPFHYIFHLAAVVGGRLSIENAPIAVATDLSIDADMWSWANSSRPMKIVNFSSSAAYPIELQMAEKAKGYLLKEGDISFNRAIGMPDMTYGWAKLTSEYLGRIAWERHGLKSVAFRPFSGYGIDQDANYPFPSLCQRVFENRKTKTVTVWGSGEQSRDFIHIDDCVRGVLKTMDRVDDGGAVNLSTGKLTTFKEFIETAAGIVGYTPRIVPDLSKPEGVRTRGGDTTFQAKLEFEAAVDLKEGVAQYFSKYGASQA